MVQNSTVNSIDQQNLEQLEEFDVQTMTELLARHFGDGIVYLRVGEERVSHLYSLAIELAYINEEGYLTRQGRMFLAKQLQVNS